MDSGEQVCLFANIKRIIQHSYLKVEKLEEYIDLHMHPWPEIMRSLQYGTLRNYTIWILGTELYNYLENVPGSGLSENGTVIRDEGELEQERAAGEKWGSHTMPCFLYHDQSIYYDDIIEIAHIDGKRSAAYYDITDNKQQNPRQRKVFRCYLNPERIEKYCQMYKGSLEELSAILLKYHIGNLSVALREEEVYLYYEYCGEQYEKDMELMLNDSTVIKWRETTEACMTKRNKEGFYEEFQQIFYSA